MQLTKEEAIKRHRMMWNWIAEETLRQHRIVTEDDAIDHFNWDYISLHCWCCEYALKRLRKALSQGPFIGNKCIFCPIKWSETDSFCVGVLSPYREWKRVIDKLDPFVDDWYDMQDAARFAREIANLPEREMEDQL